MYKLHVIISRTWIIASPLSIYYIISLESPFILWSYNRRSEVYECVIALPHSVDHSDLDSISRLTSLVYIRVVLIGKFLS